MKFIEISEHEIESGRDANESTVGIHCVKRTWRLIDP